MNLPSSLLLTDLYQLTMLQGYVEQGMEEILCKHSKIRAEDPLIHTAAHVICCNGQGIY